MSETDPLRWSSFGEPVRWGPFGESEVTPIQPGASGDELLHSELSRLYALPLNAEDMLEAVAQQSPDGFLSVLAPEIHGAVHQVDATVRGFTMELQKKAGLSEERLAGFLVGAEQPADSAEDEILTLFRYGDSLTLLREAVSAQIKGDDAEESSSDDHIQMSPLIEGAVLRGHERFSRLTEIWIEQRLIMPEYNIDEAVLSYSLTDDQYLFFKKSRDALGRFGSGTRGLLYSSFLQIFGTPTQVEELERHLHAY